MGVRLGVSDYLNVLGYLNVVPHFPCGLLCHSALALDDNSNEGTQGRCESVTLLRRPRKAWC